MGDIRVNTEAAILSFTHLQVLISWQTLLTAIVTKLTVDSCDTGDLLCNPSLYSERRAKDNSKQNPRACVYIRIFLLYEFYISTRLQRFATLEEKIFTQYIFYLYIQYIFGIILVIWATELDTILFITKGEDFIKLGTRSVSGESRILALAMVSSIIYKI